MAWLSVSYLLGLLQLSLVQVLATTQAPTPVLLNGVCNSTSACSTEYASCEAGVCQCSAGFFHNNGVCAPVSLAMPSGLRAVNLGQNNLEVKWTAPAISPSLVSGYRVGYNGTSFHDTTSRTGTLYGVAPGTSYVISVQTLISYKGQKSPAITGTFTARAGAGNNCTVTADCGTDANAVCDHGQCGCLDKHVWNDYSSTCVPGLTGSTCPYWSSLLLGGDFFICGAVEESSGPALSLGQSCRPAAVQASRR